MTAAQTKARTGPEQRRDVTPLEFLIDRSLSQVSLPAALREAGLIARTLAEVYGDGSPASDPAVSMQA